MAPGPDDHALVSPVDLPGVPIERGNVLGWAATTIAGAALLLLCANAGTLSAWIDEKPVSEAQQKLSDTAAGWAAAMNMIGISAPRTRLRELWQKAQGARFGSEAPVETQ